MNERIATQKLLDLPDDQCPEKGIYVGLDLSARGAGLCILTEKGEALHLGSYGESLKRTATVRQKVERTIYIATQIIKAVKNCKIDELPIFVGIENYTFGAKGAQNDLGEVHGVVKSQLWLALTLEPVMISCSHARLVVLGKGRFSKGKKGKKEIVEAVRERGIDVKNHDIADAYVIAECARREAK